LGLLLVLICALLLPITPAQAADPGGGAVVASPATVPALELSSLPAAETPQGPLWMSLLLAMGYVPVFLKWLYDRKRSRVVDAMLDVLFEGCEGAMAGIDYLRNPTELNRQRAAKEFRDVVIVPKARWGQLKAPVNVGRG
jgi:hypothetical protein